MRLEKLSIGYKGKCLVSDLNLSFKPGTLNAIIGVNGIGKSTLIKTLSNEINALSGSVIIDSQELSSISPKESAKLISVVLTNRAENKFLSVYELIQMGRYPYLNWLGKLTQKDFEIIEQALELFSITALRTKKCIELSDGQYQKVLIAKAFVQDTPYILLDEPSTHLDLYHKINLFKTLSDLAKNHQKCIILSTHEIERSIELADQMLLLLEKEHHFSSPKDLINKGVFNRIFPSEMVNFNPLTKSFDINTLNT